MSEVPQDPSVEEENTEKGEDSRECYVEIRSEIGIFTVFFRFILHVNNSDL